MNKKLFVKILSFALCLICVNSFVACGTTGNIIEISNYSGGTVDEETGELEFNEDLYYRNDWKFSGADPSILDDTARSGYYYIYTTAYQIYRSTDMYNWEGVGRSPDYFTYSADEGIEGTLMGSRQWAPEVIYDDEVDLYFMTLTACPDTGDSSRTIMSLVYLAISDSAEGPFSLVNFVEDDGVHPFIGDYVGEEYVRDYSAAEYDVYDGDIWLDFCVFDPIEAMAATDSFGLATSKNITYGGTSTKGAYDCGIDTTLFVDPVTGNKYMYLVKETASNYNYIWGVQLENWFTPMWETASAIVAPCAYTISDAQLYVKGGSIDRVYYEKAGNVINEGPQMTYHNGKYYVTFSANDYANSSYCVGQAVSDSPLGPFRKLTEEENGLILSSGDGNEEMAGTGHHSFLYADDAMYIVYHRYESADVLNDRGPSVDEVKWVTIEDINGDELDVLYVNGPTSTIQPKFEFNATYKNIADDNGTNVTLESGKLEEGSSIDALTDGLLSLWKDDTTFNTNYIKETTIIKTSTFTFSFDSQKTVRSIMIYDSRYNDNVFYTVSKIELTCVENGETVKKVITDLQLSETLYTTDDYLHQILYIDHGASIFTEFYEQKVTEIKITVDVPDGQDAAGISEIRILGK